MASSSAARASSERLQVLTAESIRRKHEANVPELTTWLDAAESRISSICTLDDAYRAEAADEHIHVSRVHFMTALATRLDLPLPDIPGDEQMAAEAATSYLQIELLKITNPDGLRTVCVNLKNDAGSLSATDLKLSVRQAYERFVQASGTTMVAARVAQHFKEFERRISIAKLQQLWGVYPPPDLKHAELLPWTPDFRANLTLYIAYALARLSQRCRILRVSGSTSYHELEVLAACPSPLQDLPQDQLLNLRLRGVDTSVSLIEIEDLAIVTKLVFSSLWDAEVLNFLHDNDVTDIEEMLPRKAARACGAIVMVLIIALSFGTLLSADVIPAYNWAVVAYNAFLVGVTLLRAGSYIAERVEVDHPEHWKWVAWMVCRRSSSRKARTTEDNTAALDVHALLRHSTAATLHTGSQQFGRFPANSLTSAPPEMSYGITVPMPVREPPTPNFNLQMADPSKTWGHVVDLIDNESVVNWIAGVMYVTLFGMVIDNAVDTFFHVPINGDSSQLADLAADVSNFVFGIVTIVAFLLFGKKEPVTPYGTLFWSGVFGINLAMLIQDVFLDPSGNHLQDIAALRNAQPTLTTWAAAYRLFGCAIAVHRLSGSMPSQQTMQAASSVRWMVFLAHGIRAMLIFTLVTTTLCVSIILVGLSGLAVVSSSTVPMTTACGYFGGWSVCIPIGYAVLMWVWSQTVKHELSLRGSKGAFTIVVVNLLASSTVVVSNFAMVAQLSQMPALQFLYIAASFESLCQALQHSADILSGGDLYRKFFESKVFSSNSKVYLQGILLMLFVELTVNATWLLLDFWPTSELVDITGGINFSAPVRRWCRLMSMLFRGFCLLLTSVALTRVLTASGRHFSTIASRQQIAAAIAATSSPAHLDPTPSSASLGRASVFQSPSPNSRYDGVSFTGSAANETAAMARPLILDF